MDRDVLQRKLMERNGGRAMLLHGPLHHALKGWKDLTEKSQSGEFEAPTKTQNHQKRTPNLA
jgi:hypothetical protein